MTYQSVNPYNGKVFRTYKNLSDVEVERAISLAQASFKTWKSMGDRARANIVAKAAAILHSRADEYAQFSPSRSAS